MNHQRVYPDIVGLLSPCMCSAFGYATVAIIVCRMDLVHYTHLEGINPGSFLGQTLEKASNVTRIRLQIVCVCVPTTFRYITRSINFIVQWNN